MQSFPRELLDGYASFMAGRYARERDRYRALAQDGQKPSTMIIACCDSRAAPETIFDRGPGELFVLRNVANLVPTYQPDGGQHGTSAAIEFAVNSLKVENIVVLGHGRCGGIHAALSPSAEPLDEGDFIGKWMSLLAPVAEQVGGNSFMTAAERQTALERISIRNSLNNLMTFPYVERMVREGTLALHGAWFDISAGELWVMDADSGDFLRAETVDEPEL
ncbi:carbonic anhydrase [Arsenicitalea aurantiaca]|uniref:Carbonic anhydrase n=1 Tax=Arsenicitalea aurantiaca TaxID=1783274 RepID=A0A433X5K4_9HYPH|nr:carbonic anhydrase [Arsenicitalea aurantiaca]RUT29328.1 carbonic anhydrase [Arsenicitalea aurantiaca]